MTEILTIDIIDNGRGGHGDLLFSIPNLIDIQEFDTFYFSISPKLQDADEEEVKITVARLIQFWLEKVSEIKNNETIFLPIDFSDQYTGCLKVQNQEGQLALTYGFSGREGWAVDPLDLENYYKSISDFEAYSEKKINIEQSIFISALEKQIRKLQDSIN